MVEELYGEINFCFTIGNKIATEIQVLVGNEVMFL
jgi:hypothetical protein